MHLILSNCAVANRKLSLLEYLMGFSQHSVSIFRGPLSSFRDERLFLSVGLIFHVKATTKSSAKV